jgi:hypothetical protein
VRLLPKEIEAKQRLVFECLCSIRNSNTHPAHSVANASVGPFGAGACSESRCVGGRKPRLGRRVGIEDSRCQAAPHQASLWRDKLYSVYY